MCHGAYFVAHFKLKDGYIMSTIELYKDKINSMSNYIEQAKTAVSDYCTDLSALKSKILGINSSVCDSIVSKISSSSQTQEQQIVGLEATQREVNDFIDLTIKRDNSASSAVAKAKDEFYKEYEYLKPDSEKSDWEKFCDTLEDVGEWCKEHWKLVVTVVICIAAIALICTGVGGILGAAAIGALIGAGSGGLIGGLSSIASGGSFLDGFEEGAFSGAITGAIFGGIGGAGALFGNTLKCADLAKKGMNLAKLVNVTAKVSGGASLAMDGFDALALGAGMIDPDNPLTALNDKLHSNNLYNAFQIGVNAVATFTGAASATMACFIAGTMVLTTAGLVAIENIKAGDIVISTNPDTLETAGKTVLETYIRQVDKLVHLTINSEKIVTTVDHPFYVQGRGFIDASKLLVSDKLISVNGEDLIIENFFIEETIEPVDVYNFQVEDYHTYFVGKSNVWVHNAEYGNGHYNNNPSDNPKVLADAVEDPNAVYGYRPSEDGSLKNFANEDWSNPEFVESAKQKRLQYIEDDKAIYDMIAEMKNNGCSTEEMARAACDYRNQNRLNSYLDSDGHVIDQNGYNAALERMQTRSYDALISSGKTPEEIINSSMRTNPAMDACVGLYDQNFDTY